MDAAKCRDEYDSILMPDRETCGRALFYGFACCWQSSPGVDLVGFVAVRELPERPLTSEFIMSNMVIVETK
jgi:hypothetical protein